MVIVKTLEIQRLEFEKDQYPQALSILREIIKVQSRNSIHMDIIMIQKLYNTNKLDNTYKLHKGSDRIRITDKDDETQAIIFYREVSEPVIFRVMPFPIKNN